MKQIFYILLTFLVLTPAQATNQIPEMVLYKNTEYESLNEPLTSYIDENKINIYKITQTLCSANWRGYVAKWVVSEGNLYLKEVYGNSCGKEVVIPIKSIIPGAEGRVKAEWFNGEIKLFEKGKVYNQLPVYVLEIRKGQIEK